MSEICLEKNVPKEKRSTLLYNLVHKAQVQGWVSHKLIKKYLFHFLKLMLLLRSWHSKLIISTKKLGEKSSFLNFANNLRPTYKSSFNAKNDLMKRWKGKTLHTEFRLLCSCSVEDHYLLFFCVLECRLQVNQLFLFRFLTGSYLISILLEKIQRSLSNYHKNCSTA